MKRLISLFTISIMSVLAFNAYAQNLKINDLEYFEDRGVNVFVYSNQYAGIFCDEKTAGIELVQRGVRISTGGGVRLMNTPEQWDIYPVLTERKVNKADNSIDVSFRYEDYDFDFTIKVKAKDKGVSMSVIMDEAVPAELVGKAGLNLEFFPATYFGKTFMMDGSSEILPRYPSSTTTVRPVSDKIPQFYGLSTFDDRGRGEFLVPDPISKGNMLVLSPEDDKLRVLIKSDNELNLFDGRLLSQNGTFVVRTFLPEAKTGTVVEWYVEPGYDPNWVREPNIGYSQIGYTPAQKKVAVIELDKNDPVAASAKIIKIEADGSRKVVLEPAVKEWGVFYNRYNYAQMDFSDLKEPGTYCIEYKGHTTSPFPINLNVYEDKWTTTMDVWLPVHMDHMEVNEAYRIWHGRSFMDDALQAPTNYQQHDGYSQGPVTNTKYEPWEHIPNLSVGAWYDAGDFDIQAGTVIGLTSGFATMWENFDNDRDQTYVDQETQFVDIHRPDGIPDVLQQVEHGALNLCAQVENIGFVAQGIVQVNMHQYHHLGDAMTITDNLVYSPALDPYQVEGLRSGTRDDRVAFTSNFSPAGTMTTVAALAAAARVLKDYNPEFSERCLKNALMLWDKYFADADPEVVMRNADERMRRFMRGDQRIAPAIQLWLTTGEEKYKEFFEPKVIEQLEASATSGQINLNTALSIYPYMDKKFQKKVEALVPAYVETVEETVKSNPYGVPISGRGWGGNEVVINWAYNNYYIWKYFPDMIDPEIVLNGLHYIYGCHPYSNLSFINSVGVDTKKVAYGNNRADYAVIPGGIVPGLLMLQPDLFENKDDYPFLWGENECCTRNVPNYVMLSIACEEITEALNKVE